jgi:hypothetical protein
MQPFRRRTVVAEKGPVLRAKTGEKKFLIFLIWFVYNFFESAGSSPIPPSQTTASGPLGRSSEDSFYPNKIKRRP